MSEVRIVKEEASKPKLTFLYNPAYVERIKAFKGSFLHLKEKYWPVSYPDEVIDRILFIFKSKMIEFDPVLKTTKEKPNPVANFKDLKKNPPSGSTIPRR
jgi:hypothetical protein